MKRETALKLVAQCVEAQLKIHAFDANLYRRGMVKTPRTETAYKDYERLIEAWRLVSAPLQMELFDE